MRMLRFISSGAVVILMYFYNALDRLGLVLLEDFYNALKFEPTRTSPTRRQLSIDTSPSFILGSIINS